MSTAALEALVAAQRALVVALDGDDVTGIETATAAVDHALVRLRVQSGIRPTADVRTLAGEAAALAEAARIRLNVLSDLTRRRMARLAAITGRGRQATTYGRNGRIAP